MSWSPTARSIETGELVAGRELLRQLGTVPGLAKMLERLGIGDAPSRGEAAAAVEFALEGLHLTRRLAKAQTDDGTHPVQQPEMAAASEADPAMKRNRYGAWDGGPDPLAPPYDVRGAVDELGARRAGRRQPARSPAGSAAPRSAGAGGARRSGGQGAPPAAEALRRGRLDGTVTRARSCWTRRSRRSATSCVAGTTTTPGSPRPSWTRCRDDRPGGRRAVRLRLALSDEARADLRADPGPPAARGARAAVRRA